MNELIKMKFDVHNDVEELSKEETLVMFKDFLHEIVLTLGEPQESNVFQVLVETKIGNLTSYDFDFATLFENVIRHLKGEE